MRLRRLHGHINVNHSFFSFYSETASTQSIFRILRKHLRKCKVIYQGNVFFDVTVLSLTVPTVEQRESSIAICNEYFNGQYGSSLVKFAINCCDSLEAVD